MTNEDIEDIKTSLKTTPHKTDPLKEYLNSIDFDLMREHFPSCSETWNDLECLKKCKDKEEMFELITNWEKCKENRPIQKWRTK